jgi:predicted NAD-dependent protein-ADP-ribosyltransferase YbiA (DUF1768 family)
MLIRLPPGTCRIAKFDGKYRFLSNFYPTEIFWLGRRWPTLEHAFQGTKTADPVERAAVQSAASPGLAKRLGRTVHIREDWEHIKLAVMLELLKVKI